jgi:hypothetical protein
MATAVSACTFLCFTAVFLTGGAKAECEADDVKACLAWGQQPSGDICLGSGKELQKCAEKLTCSHRDDQLYTDQLAIRGFADAAKFICNGNEASYSAVFPCLKKIGYDPADILDTVMTIEECKLYKNYVDDVRNSAAVAACGPSAGLLYAKVATRIANPLVAVTFVDDSCKYYVV